MEWNGRQFFHILFWQFFPFHFHSTLKIFHSILTFQGKFRPKTMLNLYCTFATLSVFLLVVAHEGMVNCISSHIWSTIAMTYHKNSLSINISTIGVAKIFDWWGGGQNANHMQWRHQILSKSGIFMRQIYRRMEGQKPRSACVCGP